MIHDAYNLHLKGKRCFEFGYYGEAERCYRWALELESESYEHITVLNLDLAATLQVTGRFKEAARIYNEEIANSGDYSDLARTELTKLQERKSQWSVPADAQPLTADDQRFFDIVAPMLAKYPGLVRPVHFIWVAESSQWLCRIQEIQRSYGVALGDCLQSLTGWEALGVQIGYWHLVMVKSDWQKAKDSALCGLLSHEIAHVELKDTFKGQVIDPDRSALDFVCNERITDLLAISKGFGSELLDSRRFMERIGGSLERTSTLMTPKEIERIIRH